LIKILEEKSTFSPWKQIVFSVYGSKYCKLSDFRQIYYNYLPRDFFMLQEYVHQKEAMDEVLEKEVSSQQTRRNPNGNDQK